jgi:hypothetical protein
MMGEVPSLDGWTSACIVVAGNLSDSFSLWLGWDQKWLKPANICARCLVRWKA